MAKDCNSKAVGKERIIQRRLSTIKTQNLFKTLFPTKNVLIDIIKNDILERGFDKSQPLIIWKETGVLLDGHTRLEASKRANIKTVPITEKTFKSEEEALEYAISLQINRRNLTDGELFKCISTIDMRKSHGGDRRSEHFKSSSEHLKQPMSKTRRMTAAILNTSPTKVQKVRSLMDYGSDSLKNDILDDRLTINKAYKLLKQQIQQNKNTSGGPQNEEDDTYQSMSLLNKILRLHFYGYSDSEIVRLTGIGKNEVSGYMNGIDWKCIQQKYYNGTTISVLNKEFEIDELLIWRSLLDSSKDEHIFSQFGNSSYSSSQPKLGDVWYFGKVDKRLGIDYEGRASGQALMNILYRFSKQGDLVVDPMAGGGTTSDVCLVMKRRCKAYDIHPARDDIEEHDIRLEPPKFKGKADLVVLDPPYYRKKVYHNPEIMESREAYLSFIEKVAQNSSKILKKKKYIALLFGQYIDYEDDEKNITSADVIRIFEEQGLKHTIQINCPLTMHSQYQPYKIEYAKKTSPWRMLSHSCDWEVFKKV